MRKADSAEAEVVVGGVRPAADAVAKTSRFIAAMKRRPNHRAELEEAARILGEVGVDPPSYGVEAPHALLEHWRRCVADLASGDDEPASPPEDVDERPDASE